MPSWVEFDITGSVAVARGISVKRRAPSDCLAGAQPVMNKQNNRKPRFWKAIKNIAFVIKDSKTGTETELIFDLFEENILKLLDSAEIAKSKETKIAMHGVNQFFGDNKTPTLFSDENIESFSKATGLNLTNRPTNYGVVLNQAQEKVLFGLLKAFSDTNYKGDELQDKAKALGDVYAGTTASKETLLIKENAPYKNIDAIPAVSYTHLTLPTNREV